MKLLCIAIAAAVPATLWVGRFQGSGAVPPPWRVVRLSAKVPATRYRVGVVDSVSAVEAEADKSMALLARPVSVDLATTPILCWRWWIEAPIASADMARRSGDDYAARVYVAFAMPQGTLGLGTRIKLAIARRMFGSAVPDAALNYVWDNKNVIGTWRKSAYTDRAQLIVTESGGTRARRWVTERVDIALDFARAFRGAPGKPVEIAVASDTDNTGERAHAAFADLRFVPRTERCNP